MPETTPVPEGPSDVSDPSALAAAAAARRARTAPVHAAGPPCLSGVVAPPSPSRTSHASAVACAPPRLASSNEICSFLRIDAASVAPSAPPARPAPLCCSSGSGSPAASGRAPSRPSTSRVASKTAAAASAASAALGTFEAADAEALARTASARRVAATAHSATISPSRRYASTPSGEEKSSRPHTSST
jgi:hypothetical protein